VYVEGDVVEQTPGTMRNVEAILGAAGTSLDDVVMVRAYLTRVESFPGFNTAYFQFVSEPYPRTHDRLRRPARGHARGDRCTRGA
jgi:2-iminobutanoate/2-iminopropanoate deaminase